jgi:hypothetical protein
MTHDDEQAADTREIVREEVRQLVAAISALRAEKGESSLPPDLLRELEAGAGRRAAGDRG